MKRNTTSFKERFRYWKETGESPYEAGRIKNTGSNRGEQVYEDSPSLPAAPLPKYVDGKDGTILTHDYANDVFKAFQREKDIWNDRDAVNQAINEVLKDPLFNKKEIKDALEVADNSWFTDVVNNLVNKGVMKNSEANDFIEKVADKLGVSGMRGEQYSDYGTYYGGMIGPERFGTPNRHVAFRNIDSGSHNQPILPAEWGSDGMFSRFDDPSYKRFGMRDEEDVVPVIDQSKKSITTKYAAKKYPQNVINLNPYYKKAALLRKKHHITEDELTPDEMLREISGLDQANKARIERSNHYYDQLDKWQKVRKQRNQRIDKIGKIKTGMVAAGIGGAVSLPIIGGIYQNSKKMQWFYNSDMYDKFINDPEYEKALDSEDGNLLKRLERHYYHMYRESLLQNQK